MENENHSDPVLEEIDRALGAEDLIAIPGAPPDGPQIFIPPEDLDEASTQPGTWGAEKYGELVLKGGAQ